LEPIEFAALVGGFFLLSFGLAAYRQFFKVLGLTAGLALWVVSRQYLVSLPGLQDHPGTTSVLILILFSGTGVLLATRFRRVLAFLGGFGTGVILSGMATSWFQGVPVPPMEAVSVFSRLDPMNILVGLVAGVLFILFEPFFAVFLTSSVGAFLCSWTLEGRWIFPVCLFLGFVAQPLILAKLKSVRNRTGKEEG